MSSLWFVVPAHGRLALTRICLRQLRRTCDALEQEGVRASAVVVADDENLDTARQLGFATVERDNRFLSRKFNDGIQLACDPRHNPHPVTHVVPCGSDDWVDHRLFLDLPPADTMVGFPRISIVREDGLELTTRHLNYPGGSGIRIYPAALMKPLGYRPADPDRERGCDTSIMVALSRYHEHRMVVDHRHHHDYQIVDWKSPTEQLNSYANLAHYRSMPAVDPFTALAGTYPAEALNEMRAHYALAVAA
jgi:hypothetical protein